MGEAVQEVLKERYFEGGNTDIIEGPDRQNKLGATELGLKLRTVQLFSAGRILIFRIVTEQRMFDSQTN